MPCQAANLIHGNTSFYMLERKKKNSVGTVFREDLRWMTNAWHVNNPTLVTDFVSKRLDGRGSGRGRGSLRGHGLAEAAAANRGTWEPSRAAYGYLTWELSHTPHIGLLTEPAETRRPATHPTAERSMDRVRSVL